MLVVFCGRCRCGTKTMRGGCQSGGLAGLGGIKICECSAAADKNFQPTQDSQLSQIHSCFFSHSIKLNGLPLSAVTVSLHYLPRCLCSTVTCGKTPTTVTWSEPLKICCHVIVTQQRPTVEQSARKCRNMALQAKEQTWTHHCMTLEQLTWYLCSVSSGVQRSGDARGDCLIGCSPTKF